MFFSTAQDLEVVNKAMLKTSWYQTWYEGYLTPDEYQVPPEESSDVSSFLKQYRKVYFYFSSRVSEILTKTWWIEIIIKNLHI